MAYQPKNYKKFVATAATATLVASAIAPAAFADQASTSAFTDVGDRYTDAVDYVVTNGTAIGINETQFGVGASITRGDAAIMIATAAGLMDETAPASGFSDVPKRGAVAVNSLKDAGVLSGVSTTKFGWDQQITRGQAAFMLAKAYELTGGDASKLKFTDVGKDHRFATQVAALVENKITNGATPTSFGIESSIKRGDFAIFLHRLNELETPKAPDTEAPVLKLDGSSKITVENGAKLVLPTVTVTDNVDKDIEIERIYFDADGKEIRGIDTTKAGSYQVFFTAEDAAGNVADDLIVTVVVKEAVKEAPAVKSVSAINSKQLEVTFNSEVGVGATNKDNYSVREVVNGKANVVTDAKIKSDGKTVVLTLSEAYRVSTDVAVSVDGVHIGDSIKDTFPKYSQVVTIKDTVDPEILTVTATSNTNAAQVATVKFSEPIAISDKTVFKINGSVVTGKVASGDGSEFTLSGLNLAADKVHTLEVIAFEDGAENKVAIATKTFTVTKDTTQAKGTARVVQDNKVQVKFDKAMNLESLSNVDVLRYNAAEDVKSYVPVEIDSVKLDSTGTVATFTIDGDEEANFFGVNDSKEELIVKVKSGVIDSAGNQVKTFEEKVVSTQDVTGPAFDSLTYTKNSKGEVEKFYFQFDEGLTGQPTAANFLAAVSLTNDATNASVAPASVFGTSLTDADITLAADGKTVIVSISELNEATVTNKLTSGTYKFTVASNLVKDSSFAQNGNKAASKIANFGAVANQVVVNKVAINEGVTDNKATVTFSKAVTAASAKNPANYSINGKVLPASTTIVVTDTTATFTLPAGTVAKSDASAVLKINNIKAQDSSATFNEYVGTINALDNTAPVATGSVLSNGVIQLTFSEAVDIATTDFESLELNGKELEKPSTDAATDLTVQEIALPNGAQAVTITVKPQVATNYNGTGFTYQYIDVDGDDNFDLDKDIKLKQVESATAPASWSTTISDLNLLDSVKVYTDVNTTTVDKSAYKGTGNALKAYDVITVK